MLSTVLAIFNTNTDTADLFFFLAFVLCVIAGVMRILSKAWDGALVAFGISAIALGYLFLTP